MLRKLCEEIMCGEIFWEESTGGVRRATTVLKVNFFSQNILTCFGEIKKSKQEYSTMKLFFIVKGQKCEIKMLH